MHSRVFQVSTKPIEEEDYLKEEDFYDCHLVGGAMDYITDWTDRDDDIKWFANCYKKVLKVEGDKFTIVDKDAYFKKKYEEWIKCLKELAKTSFEDFKGDDNSFDELSFREYHTHMLFEDNGEFHVQFEDINTLMTIDDFMRHVHNGETYYFGGTLDYHY